MVVSAVRYEPVSLLLGRKQGDFREKQGRGRQKCQKLLRHRHFVRSCQYRQQGETGSGNLLDQGRAKPERVWELKSSPPVDFRVVFKREQGT